MTPARDTPPPSPAAEALRAAAQRRLEERTKAPAYDPDEIRREHRWRNP